MDAPLIEEPPLRVLFADLASQTSTLVSKEIALAKHELTAKAEFAVKRGMVVAVGALAVAVSMLVLLAALILALGTVMPLWAAALIVGLAVAAVGTGAALYGLQAIKKLDMKPTQTIETLTETKLWLKRELAK